MPGRYQEQKTQEPKRKDSFLQVHNTSCSWQNLGPGAASRFPVGQAVKHLQGQSERDGRRGDAGGPCG